MVNPQQYSYMAYQEPSNWPYIPGYKPQNPHPKFQKTATDFADNVIGIASYAANKAGQSLNVPTPRGIIEKVIDFIIGGKDAEASETSGSCP